MRILRSKIQIVDATLSDFQANETKNDAWEYIQSQFVRMHPDRHLASVKEIRGLWRRMKHRARMEVRQKVQNAKAGAIPTMSEDDMGWMPDQNHTVIDINDLGLDPVTKTITEFVPLLEEEATVLETRNGVLHGVKRKEGQMAGIDLQENEDDVGGSMEVIDYELVADESNDDVQFMGNEVKTERKGDHPIDQRVQVAHHFVQ